MKPNAYLLFPMKRALLNNMEMISSTSTNVKMENDISCHPVPNHELSVAHNNKSKLMNEVRKWKDRAQRAEERLKLEKKTHEGDITRLGFKMLQFENELRKEQREIEQQFIEKDKQIKILEDLISDFHDRLKTNTLCYNCFLIKHHSPHTEHNLHSSGQDFDAKFPLDLLFSERKSPTHSSHDSRGRSLSLPLNLQNQHESPKSNAEFCFHHMLSPVPEELENNFLEHAKRANQESLIEEEDEEEEDEKIENKVVLADSGLGIDLSNIESPRVETISDSGLDLISQASESQNVEKDISNEKSPSHSFQGHTSISEEDNFMESSAVEIVSSSTDETVNVTNLLPAQELHFKGEADEIKSFEEKTIGDKADCGKDLEANVYFDVKLIIYDLIDQIPLQETVIFKDRTLFETNHDSFFQYENKAVEEIASKEPGEKTPLSPKSEVIVAELKKAIFEASLEVENRTDDGIKKTITGIEEIKEESESCFGGNSCQNDDGNFTKDDRDKTTAQPSSEQDNVSLVLGDTSAVLIEQIDLQFNDENIFAETPASNIEEMPHFLANHPNEHHPPQTVSDELIDYDVIELE